jgi:hypothetical protein
MRQVTAQMYQGHRLLAPVQPLAAQDRPGQLAQGLYRALRPAGLLPFERRNLGRDFGRRVHRGQIEAFPAGQLGSIAQVQILAESIGLPATGLLNAAPPPYPCSPVKTRQQAGAIPSNLLDDKVTIERQRLGAGQGRVIGVDIRPARLYHAQSRPRKEVRDCLE